MSMETIGPGPGPGTESGRRRRELLLASALLIALTIVMTWPQALLLSNHVNDRGDPLLNAWALAWVAHQLPRDPAHLFDANIFHPERAVLAYSESLVLPAVLIAPLRWIGVHPIATYNLVMLAGFAASGIAMFVLVRRLTGSAGAALISAVAFAFLPYRFDHYPQVQLQLAMWMPLALWSLHRTLDTGRLRDGLATGAAVACQAWSCLYYAIFFAPYLVLVGGVLGAGTARQALMGLAAFPSKSPASRASNLAVLLLLAAALGYLALGLATYTGHPLHWSVAGIQIRATRFTRLLVIASMLGGAAALVFAASRWKAWVARWRDSATRQARRRIVALAAGAMLAAFLTAPLIPPYQASRMVVGERTTGEIGGASLRDYLAAPPSNRLYGPRTAPLGGPERYLFPGFATAALAIIGLWPPWSRTRLAYAAGLLFAFDVSRGLSGWSYAFLYELLPPFRAVRVASRMGFLTAMTLTILAGLGAAALLNRVTRLRRAPAAGCEPPAGASKVGGDGSRRWLVASAVVVVLAESASAPLILQRVPRNPPEVSRWLATLPPTAVLELPLGVDDTLLMYFSIWHWQPLANGFSGFFPHSYTHLKHLLAHFPDDASLDAVRARGIQLIVVHESLMRGDPYRRVTEGLARRGDVRPVATFGFPGSEARVYAVSEPPASSATGSTPLRDDLERVP